MSILRAVLALYRWLGPAHRLFWVTLGLDLVVAAWSVVTFLSASMLVQSFFDVGGLGVRGGGGGLDGLFAWGHTLVRALPKEQQLMLGLAATVASMVTGNAMRLGALALSLRFLRRFTVYLQSTCFERMLAARLERHDETRRSQLSQLVIVEVKSCYNLMKEFCMVFGNAVLVAVQLAIMLLISPLATLFFFSVGCGAWLLSNRLNTVAKRWSGAALGERNALMAVTHEALYGIKPVKLLSYEGSMTREFRARADGSVRLFSRVGVLVNGQAALVQAIGLVAMTLIIGVSFWNPTLLPTARAVLFLFVAVQVVTPVSVSARSYGLMHQSLPAVQAVTTFLADSASAREVDGTRARARLIEQRIVFEHVTLDYPSRPGVLRDVDLEIHRGDRVGVVGASGSGKTSLVNLIPRLYDPARGAVRVDGVDVRDLRLGFLRGRIGMLSQDVFVFNGTVRDNILMGRLDATEAEMVAAARLAHAHEFIMELPQGYDTVVGDRGMKLSGGQRQRINIAQVFLRDPEVLILDEATSALDSESEALVQEAIDRLSRERTVLVIAHRLSTLRGVDRVIVLDGGRVIEQGRLDELLRANGVFARMWEMQASAIG